MDDGLCLHLISTVLNCRLRGYGLLCAVIGSYDVAMSYKIHNMSICNFLCLFM